MSLNWNVANVENHETVCFRYDSDGERYISQSTESLIFLTMVVGMGEITADNYKEFYKRVALFERLRGAVRVKFEGERYLDDPFTLEDIRQHIGLHTNASTEKPAAYRKRILESWEHDLLIERRH